MNHQSSPLVDACVRRYGLGQESLVANHSRLEALARNLEALRPALESLINDCAQNIADIGGCDHSVNICCCDLKDNLAQARAALALTEKEGA